MVSILIDPYANGVFYLLFMSEVSANHNYASTSMGMTKTMSFKETPHKRFNRDDIPVLIQKPPHWFKQTSRQAAIWNICQHAAAWWTPITDSWWYTNDIPCAMLDETITGCVISAFLWLQLLIVLHQDLWRLIVDICMIMALNMVLQLCLVGLSRTVEIEHAIKTWRLVEKGEVLITCGYTDRNPAWW